jgi:hypothetical protein
MTAIEPNSQHEEDQGAWAGGLFWSRATQPASRPLVGVLSTGRWSADGIVSAHWRRSRSSLSPQNFQSHQEGLPWPSEKCPVSGESLWIPGCLWSFAHVQQREWTNGHQQRTIHSTWLLFSLAYGGTIPRLKLVVNFYSNGLGRCLSYQCHAYTLVHF